MTRNAHPSRGAVDFMRLPSSGTKYLIPLGGGFTRETDDDEGFRDTICPNGAIFYGVSIHDTNGSTDKTLFIVENAILPAQGATVLPPMEIPGSESARTDFISFGPRGIKVPQNFAARLQSSGADVQIYFTPL